MLEQVAIKGRPSKSLLGLLRDHLVRWQLLTIMVITFSIQFSGVSAVSISLVTCLSPTATRGITGLMEGPCQVVKASGDSSVNAGADQFLLLLSPDGSGHPEG